MVPKASWALFAHAMHYMRRGERHKNLHEAHRGFGHPGLTARLLLSFEDRNVEEISHEVG
jgi:hypothetical protein